MNLTPEQQTKVDGLMEIEGHQLGVIIGRFQIDDLHEGHLALINHVEARHGSLLILLGVRPASTTKGHPLDYRTRERMIKQLYPYAQVLPLMDCSTNETWSRLVDTTIKAAFPVHRAIIYGGQDNSLDSYSGKHTTRTVDVSVNTNHATQRRERLACNPLDTADFRAGVIYAIHAQRHRVDLTVDVAGVTRGVDRVLRVLLGRKPGETKWRLPGGFVDPTDESTLMAAKREFTEETGVHAESMQHVGDFIVDDWRAAGQPDLTIRTTLYIGTVRDVPSHAKGDDDLDEVKWVPLAQLDDEMHMSLNIVPAHRPLIRAVIATLAADGVEKVESVDA